MIIAFVGCRVCQLKKTKGNHKVQLFVMGGRDRAIAAHPAIERSRPISSNQYSFVYGAAIERSRPIPR
jgi:hypothetical protein